MPEGFLRECVGRLKVTGKGEWQQRLGEAIKSMSRVRFASLRPKLRFYKVMTRKRLESCTLL